MRIKHDRDILDIAQFAITIVTAIVAVRLNYLQGELSRRVQREGITQTYADKILTNLDRLKMDPEQRGTIIIDMLDIITEANINSGEQPYSDSERQQLIPLRLALATRDADLIAHIGTAKRKRELWTDTAIESGNDDIKRTAIHALGQIGRYRGRVAELETFRFCVEKILEISDDFARVALTQEAVDQFSVMIKVTQKVPILLEDEPLKALIKRGRDALVIAESTMIKEHAEQQQAAPTQPTPSPTPPALKPAVLSSGMTERRANGLQKIAFADDDPTMRRTQAMRGFEHSRPFLVASIFSNLLKQVDGLNLKAAQSATVDKISTATTIEALKSDVVDTRRKAREDLAAGGAANVPLLLAALRKEPDNYRIKVGVSVSLYKMTDSVLIRNPADADLLVQLAADEELEVRQYASEFLMRLSDTASVRTIFPELQKTIERRQAIPQPNENAVYNAVVILATWVRTLPDQLASDKKEIADYLIKVASKLPKDKWPKTLAMIAAVEAEEPTLFKLH